MKKESGPLPEKNIIFVPKNDKFGCILTQFFTNKTQSLEALGDGFYGLIVKQSYKKSAKIIQKFTVRPKRGVALSPPREYATDFYHVNFVC